MALLRPLYLWKKRNLSVQLNWIHALRVQREEQLKERWSGLLGQALKNVHFPRRRSSLSEIERVATFFVMIKRIRSLLRHRPMLNPAYTELGNCFRNFRPADGVGRSRCSVSKASAIDWPSHFPPHWAAFSALPCTCGKAKGKRDWQIDK